jgi:hypothetical protein
MDHGIWGKDGNGSIEIAFVEGITEMTDNSFVLFVCHGFSPSCE